MPNHVHDHADAAQPGPLADASVRVARSSDVPAVGLVQAVVFRAAYAGVLSEEVIAQFRPEAFASAWRASLAAPPSGEHILLVACAGDQVAGLAALGPSTDPDRDEDSAELIVLGVHPDARRQGHGSRLVNAVADTAHGRGRGRLDVWVLASADDSQAFLTAAGFRPDGAHRERVVTEDGGTVRELRLTVGTERA